MEESIEEKFDDIELICNPCDGQWQTLEVADDRKRVFNLKLYRRLILRCNLCGKTSKIFTEKIKQ